MAALFEVGDIVEDNWFNRRGPIISREYQRSTQDVIGYRYTITDSNNNNKLVSFILEPLPIETNNMDKTGARWTPVGNRPEQKEKAKIRGGRRRTRKTKKSKKGKKKTKRRY
jgi:hypothetical protein